MKISRITQGVAILVLATAGALAKSREKTEITVWYKPGLLKPCTATTIDFLCVVDPLGGCVGKIGRPSEGHQLYFSEDCEFRLKPV